MWSSSYQSLGFCEERKCNFLFVFIARNIIFIVSWRRRRRSKLKSRAGQRNRIGRESEYVTYGWAQNVSYWGEGVFIMYLVDRRKQQKKTSKRRLDWNHICTGIRIHSLQLKLLSWLKFLSVISISLNVFLKSSLRLSQARNAQESVTFTARHHTFPCYVALTLPCMVFGIHLNLFWS